MKKTKQTALTAAVFAAALGVSQAGSTASAAAKFSPESQQTAAVLYGPPPVTSFGDGDGNKMIDARDLTLLKRRLITQDPRTKEPRILHEHYSPDYTVPSKPQTMDLDENRVLNPADVRELRNRLTGKQEPTEFFIRFLPVPYFSDEVPESEAERSELLDRASRMSGENYYRIYIMNSGSTNPEIATGNNGAYPMYSLRPQGIRLDFSAVPDPDDPDRTVMKATVLLQKTEFSPSQLGMLNEIPMPQGQQEEDIRFDVEYITREVLEDGSVRYYDKLEAEYNMLTGELRIGKPIPQDEAIGMPDFGIGWPF